jgi:hypothetical protein
MDQKAVYTSKKPANVRRYLEVQCVLPRWQRLLLRPPASQSACQHKIVVVALAKCSHSVVTCGRSLDRKVPQLCESARRLTPDRLPRLTPLIAAQEFHNIEEILGLPGSRLEAERGQTSEPNHTQTARGAVNMT